jgi:MYXO-CTERM domain-containing protein
MLRFRSLQVFLTTAATFTTVGVASIAHADVAPPDECTTGAAGSPCTTAGPNFDEDGVCTTEAHPCSTNPTVDSGTCPILLCELADAGAGKKDAGVCTPAGSACTELIVCCDGLACVNGASGEPVCGHALGLADGSAPTVDAGKPTEKDAGKTTEKDAGEPTSKDAGKATTGDASTSLQSSSGCSVTASSSSGSDAAWFVGLGAVGLALSASRRRRSRA